jgi:hypothetical protein
MRNLKLTAAVLAFAMPTMALAAVDGTVGATSTGSFGASIVINPNTDNHVQVRGLQDLVFPVTTVSATQQTVGSSSFAFCLTKNTPGNIRFVVSQVGASGGSFELTNSNSGQKLPLELVYYDNVQTILNTNLVRDQPYVRVAQAPTCIAGSGGDGIRAIYGALQIPANYAWTGQFSGVIDILLMPE